MPAARTRRIETAPTTRPRGHDAPSRVGRYLLHEAIGEGGMGRVHRAELEGEDGFRKIVALKILHDVGGPMRYAVEAALRHEARIGAMLNHPNVVDVYDYGVDDGRPWIALEYVDGVTLDAVLRSGRRLPPTVALDVALQLCSALAHVHRLHDGTAPLVHRDLKPSNILLSRHGVVKLTDFGIAKTDLVSGCTTASGIMKGTPSFIAPEQILGLRVDGRADLFATGAVLYELATGRRLFRRHHSDAMIAAVLAVDEVIAAPHVLAEVDDHIPGLAEVVQRCLQRDPHLRYDSAEQLAAALEILRHELPPGRDLRSYKAHLDAARASGEYPELPDSAIGAPVAESAADAILRLARRPRKVVVSAPRPLERTRRRPRVETPLVAITHVALFLAALTWGGPTESPAQPHVEPPPHVAAGPTPAVVVVPAPAPPEEVEPRAVEDRVAPPWISAEDVADDAADLEEDDGDVEGEGAMPDPAAPTTAPRGRLVHPHPIAVAEVGQRRSFIVRVHGEAESVALVLEPDGEPPQRRALSRFRDGFWGLVVPFFGDMEGPLAYRFEGPGLVGSPTFEMTVTRSGDAGGDRLGAGLGRAPPPAP